MRILLLVAIIAYYATSLNEGGVNAEGDFASRYFKAVVKYKTQNVICSPMSTELLLSILKLGALGITQKQIESLLSNSKAGSSNRTMQFFNDINNDTELKLRMVSNGFIAEHYPLKRTFNKMLDLVYNMSMENIDFYNEKGASKWINKWSAVRTSIKINNQIVDGKIQPRLRLLLANSIYFKGAWAKPFHPSETELGPFHVNGRTIKKVPIMHKRGLYLNGALTNFNATFFKMPYRSQDRKHRLSMYIILPNAVDGFIDLIKNIDKITIDMLRDNELKTEIEIFMPKFKVETSLSVRAVLMRMGVKYIFREDANFMGMMENKNVTVKSILQTAVLEVNEAGSETAAVTATSGVDGAYLPVKSYTVDRPFFSIIATNTGVVVFSALIVDPLKE